MTKVFKYDHKNPEATYKLMETTFKKGIIETKKASATKEGAPTIRPKLAPKSNPVQTNV